MIAARLAALVGAEVERVEPLGGAAYRARLGDGRSLFVKRNSGEPSDFLAAQADGLRWLADAGAGIAAEVVAVDADLLALEWLAPASPSAGAAERFGTALAVTHRAAPAAYGAPWPGYIGPLPMPNDPAPDWPAFYAERRVLPFLRLAADRGAVDRGTIDAVEAVVRRLPDIAGGHEPIARLHGDLWSGNVLWTAGGARVVDPAAHGGHRETDLAMLALFGAPHVEAILAAYDATWPLADGWRARIPLHQLHPLLVHAALFGAGYGRQAGEAARAALRAM